MQISIIWNIHRCELCFFEGNVINFQFVECLNRIPRVQSRPPPRQRPAVAYVRVYSKDLDLKQMLRHIYSRRFKQYWITNDGNLISFHQIFLSISISFSQEIFEVALIVNFLEETRDLWVLEVTNQIVSLPRLHFYFYFSPK